MKGGDSTTYKRKEIPMGNKERMQTADRYTAHRLLHPNDDGKPKNKKVTWGNIGKRTKKLNEFYKQHIYTFVDRDMNKAWVRVAGFEGEEE